ncbi:hypothetical protein PVAND_009230 [Polypedilum vanderplanki]|uniref:Gustatory receptor n=1 Tax=Polypedilum vanderplanki TaxID=319348 RepID=A0A9J6CC26_POLVA|nr:hypothetical protein PVAND_009230 [Polypedilum vanderplanki]
MSLFFNTDDGLHLERVNATQMAKRGIFVNVKSANDDHRVEGGIDFLEPPPSFYEMENNLSISPMRRRDAFTKTIKKDIIFDCLQPIYNFLRAFGVFPLTKVKNGETEEFQFRFKSRAMAYSLVIFIFLMIYMSYTFIKRIEIVQNVEGRFEEAVIAYLFIVNLLPIFIVPIMWYEAKKVASILNEWSDFEKIYYKTTGKQLEIADDGVELPTKALVISILLPILSTASVVLTHYVIRIEETDIETTFVLQVIPYCYLDTLTYMVGAFWYISCEVLSHSARILAEDFQKALRHIGPAAMVASYRAMWLQLSKITRHTGTTTCYTFTFINLYLFFVITLSVYGLMSQISEGFGMKDIGLAITALCNVSLLFFICDKAHQAAFNVKTIFQKKILMVELSWMNSDAQVEINMFLRATEMNQANINLGGFFDVNRTLFKSLGGTMVTYLVVLLQFQISIPSEEPNATSYRARNISHYES